MNARVACARDYAISNVLYVNTGRSVVVIDTTESMSAARASFEEFRKTCALPVSHIIYTHFHGDHIRGARVFHTPATQIVAHRLMPEERATTDRMLRHRRRITALQFGFGLKPEERALGLLNEPESGYLPPDILFDEEYRFQEGELSFELYHAPGETVDHLMVWIPEIRTLFPGDLYYNSFPMLSNPMRADRPVAGWAESLERMRTFEPMYVVPSHGVPLMGTDEIDTVLANYARAIRHVHGETLERIQRGLPLDVIRQQVSLPAELACLPYLQEHYGKVAWSVNGVYRQYTGWYSLNPADLNPVPHAQLARAVLEACGGAAPIVARARRALRNGQDQMALQLTDLVMTARPQHRGARAVRLEALERLAAATQNGVEQNIYRSAAAATSAWLADPFNAATSGFPWLDFSGVWRRQPRHLLDSALPPEKARRPPKQADRPGTAGTTVAVNRWYDTRMYADWAQDIYAGSDFHNYGYWTETTASPKEASENLMEVLLAFIPLKSGTILDVACGKGATTRHLLNYYRPRDVTGINISEKQLETCRANAPECTFLLMNATDLEFEDETFDNIICVEAAFHFDPRAKFLSEAHRVLKPGGRLVLSDIVAFEGLADRFPDGQLVLGPEDYRSLYFEAGFEQLEIVDATAECRSAFMRHHLRKLRERKRRGEIDATRFGRQKARILEKERYGGYYLLVSAQKANAVPAA